MVTDTQKHLTASWRGPRSVCGCGHLGDGSDSEHGSVLSVDIGHGACRVAGCACQHFTWTAFTPKFMAALTRTKET